MLQELNVGVIERNTDVARMLDKFGVEYTEDDGLWSLQWPNDKQDLKDFRTFDPAKRQFYLDGGQQGFGMSKMYALITGAREEHAPALLLTDKELWLKDISDKVFKTTKSTEIVSMVCPDGTLVEQLYDWVSQEAKFAIKKPDGEVSISEKFEHQGQLYTPVLDDLIKQGVVLLPSEVGELRDEAELLSYIQGYLHYYVDVDEHFERLATYYALFTWLYDSFSTLPYLRMLGQHGTGKSRFLRTLGYICYRPMNIGGAVSTASVYRMLERYGGTLLIDEADYPKSSEVWALLVQILNLGYEVDGRVIRCDNKAFDPKPYSCYGPKLIASRKPFNDDALDSRCLTAIFYPTQRDDIPLQTPRGIEWEDAQKIRNMLLAWRFAKFSKHGADEIGFIQGGEDGLEPRLEQIIRPLQFVLESENAKQDIEEFVKDYGDSLKQERKQSLPGLVLKGLVELLDEGKEPYYHAIAEKVQPWLENPGYILTGRKIGFVIRKELHLQSRTGTGNKALIIVNDEAISRISKVCRRYGLALPIGEALELGLN